MTRTIASSIMVACVVSAAVFAATPALAQPLDMARFYTVDWRIHPASAPFKDQWVTPKSRIAEARMVPVGLYRLEAPVRHMDGRLIADADSLVVTTNHARPLGCQLTLAGMKAPLDVADKRNAVLGCFIDSDNDGAFDRWFLRSLFVGDFTWNQSMVPKKTLPIPPVRFRLEAQGADGPSIPIYLHYDYFAGGADRLIFQTCNAADLRGKWVRCLYPRIEVKRSMLPAEFDALGGRFRVSSKEEDRVQLSELKPMGDYLLSVRR